MLMKLLIVEDNKDILHFLKISLKTEGFVVDAEEDGEKGLFLACTNHYDLIILDLNLPGKNGDQICQEYRKAGKTVPILMLTVLSETESKVKLLDLGADDYITKPFSFNELLARIRALLRRPQKMEEEVLSVGDLTLYKNRQKVTYEKQEIQLTSKEFQILECLMRRQGEVVSKISIIESVWDSKVDLFSNSLETHILNLRKKIDLNKPDGFIRTVSGRGYIIR